MLRRSTLSALFICVGLVMAARPAAAEVKLTMSAGRVSLSAKNATIGQILAEWARVGQTKIVNPERVPGGPMTLELTDVSEVEALEILLRAAGGYVLAPRHAGAANASQIDRILILPQSAPVSSAPRVATAPPPQPRPFAPPQPGQIAFQPAPQPDGNADDPPERPVATPATPNPRPPVFNTFPQAAPQRTEPQAPPAPTSSVTMPVGVSVPGMVVPTPQPAGQPGVAAPQQQQPRYR